MPKETNKRTARQKDADELHMTSTLSPPSIDLLTLIRGDTLSIDTTLDISLSVFRDAILGAATKDFSTIQTVLDSIKDTDGIKKITDTVTVAGTVTANAGTNLNTSALALSNTETDDGVIDELGVRETPIALGYSWDDNTGTWRRIQNAGGAASYAIYVSLRESLADVNVTQDSIARTITGTVTANAGTNLNTSALATHVKQDTIIGHIDGIEALLATIDADTSQLRTVLDSIKDTDGIKKITDALPTGDNTIGRVKVTDGTNIMPTMDVAARKGFMRPTDGSNFMPMMDTAARRAYVELSSGGYSFDVFNDAGMIPPGAFLPGVIPFLYAYDVRADIWDRLGGIYDYNTNTVSLATSRAAGKSTFSEEYGASQTNTAIITPSTGNRLQIAGVITAIDADTGDMLLDFATSGQKVWRHYGARFKTQCGTDVAFIGDPDEALTLNSTQGANNIFVLVNYREIEP